MSDLVGNPEDRFSHNKAHFVCIDVATCESEQNVKPDPKVIKPFFMLNSTELKIYPAHKCNQRTNGPVNAHLISWPCKAQKIQNLENIW